MAAKKSNPRSYRGRATLKPMPATLTAQALIDATRKTTTSLDAETRADLAALLTHNDAAAKPQRVSAEAAIELLAQRGVRMARSKFDKLIVREFGRKWGSK